MTASSSASAAWYCGPAFPSVVAPDLRDHRETLPEERPGDLHVPQAHVAGRRTGQRERDVEGLALDRHHGVRVGLLAQQHLPLEPLGCAEPGREQRLRDQREHQEDDERQTMDGEREEGRDVLPDDPLPGPTEQAHGPSTTRMVRRLQFHASSRDAYVLSPGYTRRMGPPASIGIGAPSRATASMAPASLSAITESS
jgi:hypothetical protein